MRLQRVRQLPLAATRSAALRRRKDQAESAKQTTLPNRRRAKKRQPISLGQPACMDLGSENHRASCAEAQRLRIFSCEPPAQQQWQRWRKNHRKKLSVKEGGAQVIAPACERLSRAGRAIKSEFQV
ncbi:hypothetical protein MRX96_039837 [Rhipicephalus microplus]